MKRTIFAAVLLALCMGGVYAADKRLSLAEIQALPQNKRATSISTTTYRRVAREAVAIARLPEIERDGALRLYYIMLADTSGTYDSFDKAYAKLYIENVRVLTRGRSRQTPLPEPEMRADSTTGVIKLSPSERAKALAIAGGKATDSRMNSATEAQFYQVISNDPGSRKAEWARSFLNQIELDKAALWAERKEKKSTEYRKRQEERIQSIEMALTPAQRGEIARAASINEHAAQEKAYAARMKARTAADKTAP